VEGAFDMRTYTPADLHSSRMFGRYSLLRHFVVRGMFLAGAAVLVVLYRGGVFDKWLTTSVIGMLNPDSSAPQPWNLRQPSQSRIAGSDCSPFVCASAPIGKWIHVPAASRVETDEPYRPPDPLVIRSALTGEPYPPPDKTPVFPNYSYPLLTPGPLTIFQRANNQ
jgi:hypothetical protein